MASMALISDASKALISVALPILISEIRRVYGETQGVKKELDKLEIKLSLIQDVLEDAEQKQFQKNAVQEWLWRLRDVTYDAEDLLDEWATKAQKQDDESQSLITQLCKCILPLSELTFRWCMAKKIKEIKERFDEIKEQSSEFNLMKRVAKTRKEVGESSRDPTDSLVTESEIWGRDKDKKKVVELLRNGNNYEKDLFVLPIVGMGGIGKTTLAQLVYSDPQVVGHFQLRMWVCVSENFELIRLTRDIYESAKREKINLETLNPLQESLQETLKDKKFLLVLDDVWNEDQEKWHRLKRILNCSEGSAIIVTTRSESIATMMGSSSQYHKLEGLSNADCWSLFEQCAFGGESSEESQNLVAIGKQIVKKCGGLPLAVKALGSLLSSERDEEEWEIMRDSEILKLPYRETDILPALRLSYDHLPFQLRRCFAYCSIFPKDYEIKRKKLIYLWIANDFILPNVGNQIFNQLVRCSLLQVTKRRSGGKIISCKMHDLLHDLARYVTGSEFFTLVNAGEADGVSKETRHLFFVGRTIPKTLCDAQKVRGLISRGRLDLNQIVNLRLLRLLDLSQCESDEMSSSIGNLFHLRYLDLSYNGFSTLPKSVSDLQNLQHLDITGCNNCQSLPPLGQLPSLKHLRIEAMAAVKCIGADFYGEDKSKSFPSLQKFKVKGMDNLEEWSFVEDKRKVFPCLNKLVFTRLRKLSYFPEGLLRNCTMLKTLKLKSCQKLRTLGRDVDGLVALELLTIDSCHEMECLSEEGIRGLSCLKELKIENCQKLRTLGRGVDSLVALELLTIKSCHEMQCLSEEGIRGLSYLRELEIHDCSKLTTISPVFEELPSLKTLSIYGCEDLMSLPGGLGKLSHLESLAIGYCTRLTSFPQEGIGGLTSLQQLYLYSLVNLTSLPEGIGRLTSLQELHLVDLHSLTSLPEGIGGSVKQLCLGIDFRSKLSILPATLQPFTALKRFALWGFDNLDFLPEGGLPSLEEWEIRECRNLTTSVFGEWVRRLTALKKLQINSCNQVSTLPADLHRLTSLRELQIWNCDNLISLSEEGLRGLTALEVLIISNCSKLSSLPAALQQLTSLSELKIRYCENLTSLPEEGVRGLTVLKVLNLTNCPKLSKLPAALQQLTIQTLYIKGCHPELLTQVERKTGEEWLKIAHIPNISTSSTWYYDDADNDNDDDYDDDDDDCEDED